MNADKDDFDLPDDVPPEPVKIVATDLHLGAAEARPFSQQKWLEQNGPKAPGPGIRALDLLIITMFVATTILMLKACAWAVFS